MPREMRIFISEEAAATRAGLDLIAFRMMVQSGALPRPAFTNPIRFDLDALDYALKPPEPKACPVPRRTIKA